MPTPRSTALFAIAVSTAVLSGCIGNSGTHSVHTTEFSYSSASSSASTPASADAAAAATTAQRSTASARSAASTHTSGTSDAAPTAAAPTATAPVGTGTPAQITQLATCLHDHGLPIDDNGSALPTPPGYDVTKAQQIFLQCQASVAAAASSS